MLVDQRTDHDDLLTRGADDEKSEPMTHEEFDVAYSEHERRVYRVHLWDEA
jgi:stress response protein YsnF